MTAATKRRAAREAKKDADFRALNIHMIGTRHATCGKNLAVGQEWNTPDGFRLRVIEARPNPNEENHFVGVIEVIAFADGSTTLVDRQQEAGAVRKAANSAALEMMRTLGGNCTQAVRTMAKESVLEMYRIKVEYAGIPGGMPEDWLTGWRKGV